MTQDQARLARLPHESDGGAPFHVKHHHIFRSEDSQFPDRGRIRYRADILALSTAIHTYMLAFLHNVSMSLASGKAQALLTLWVPFHVKHRAAPSPISREAHWSPVPNIAPDEFFIWSHRKYAIRYLTIT